MCRNILNICCAFCGMSVLYMNSTKKKNMIYKLKDKKKQSQHHDDNGKKKKCKQKGEFVAREFSTFQFTKHRVSETDYFKFDKI